MLRPVPRLDSYQKLCTEFYDLDKPEPPKHALDFYRARIRAAGQPVLEAMCGSGRFLVPLASEGVDIDGVDASPHMLDACRRKASARGLTPRLELQFLQELSLPRRYRLVLVPAGSFGLIIEPEDAERALARIHEHMLPGAELVVEVLTPRALALAPGAPTVRRVTRPDGAVIVLTQDEPGTNRYELVVDRRVVETEIELFPIRVYEPAEFEAALLRAGFANVRMQRPWRDQEPDARDATIVYRCTRA
jgi:SAM-dependent methyltransferase